jgi:hypothetical protein
VDCQQGLRILSYPVSLAHLAPPSILFSMHPPSDSICHASLSPYNRPPRQFAQKKKKAQGLDTTDLGPGWGDESIPSWITLQFLLRERWHRAVPSSSSCSHSVLKASRTHQCLADRVVPPKFAPSRCILIRQVSQPQRPEFVLLQDSRLTLAASSTISIHTSPISHQQKYLVTTLAWSTRYFSFCAPSDTLVISIVPCRPNRTLHMQCSRIHDDGISSLWSRCQTRSEQGLTSSVFECERLVSLLAMSEVHKALSYPIITTNAPHPTITILSQDTSPMQHYTQTYTPPWKERKIQLLAGSTFFFHSHNAPNSLPSSMHCI